VVANVLSPIGAWDGNEYAAGMTGTKIWSTPIASQTPNCSGGQIFGVVSTATVADVTINGTSTSVVYVGGRDPSLKLASVYALDAASSAIIWKAPLSSSTGGFSWSSPAVYNGSAYIGLASVDDCPLVRGALPQLDAVTGKFIWQDCLKDGGVLGPVSAVSGVVFVSEGSHLLAMSAATGKILLKLHNGCRYPGRCVYFKRSPLFRKQ